MNKEQIIKRLEEQLKAMEERLEEKNQYLANAKHKENEFQYFRQLGKAEELENEIISLKHLLSIFKD